MTSLLSQVDSPKALRALTPSQLAPLCEELRTAIIEVCGQVGGHLGASLGAVELTVALHRVYSTPFDSIVFDVGHQAYAHKLLTGRQARFHSLRQEGGIAPFLDPLESEHDAFGAGHACTAISVALGIIAGHCQTRHQGNVVAVIGDGALTGGLSFEGLNNVALSPRPLCLVINDNGMSISKNVGAIERLLHTDARPFFESMGLNYLGQFDGHDLVQLEHILRQAKQSSRSTVVHVKTQKGRGFEPARADQRTLGHAMGPFEWRDGKLVRSRQGKQTYSERFAEVLEAAMELDARIVVATPAMLEGSALVHLHQRFPDRVFDVGIAEQHALAWAAGAAKAGARPVICIYSTFLQRAFDQLVHDIALPNLPVTLAVDRAGLVGADGATHQGAFDIAMIRMLPNFTLQSPVFHHDLADSLDRAIKSNAPAAIRFPRGTVPAATAELEDSRELRWHQEHPAPTLTLVAFGPTVLAAVAAAHQQPWSVVEVRSLPLSSQTIEALSSGPLLTLEEATLSASFGSAVLEGLARLGRRIPVRCLGLPADRFIRHGEANQQRQQLGLSAEGIARSAVDFLRSIDES